MNMKPLAGLLALATTLGFAAGPAALAPPPPILVAPAATAAASVPSTVPAAASRRSVDAATAPSTAPSAPQAGSTHEIILQSTTARGVTTASSAPSDGADPAVRHTIIEDDSTRIDELRVRGQLQRIVVTSKATGTSYEIITGDGSRELFESATNTRGAAGRRVWNVLRF